MYTYEQAIYQNTNTIIEQNQTINSHIENIADSMATIVAILLAIAISMWANFIHHIFDSVYKYK